MGEAQQNGYVENLFDRAKAIRFEELLKCIGVSVTKHGEELRGMCPIPAHGGEKKKPSFYVNPSKQVYNCFGCKSRGNIVKFAQAYNGLADFETKKAALWIVETVSDKEVVEQPHVEVIQDKVDDEPDDELLIKLFVVASEQLIGMIAKHADNPRPLAERLARWAVEALKP